MNRTHLQLFKASWIAILLSGIGGALYMVQSWVYAHSQDSVLDEGAYLVKGLLFTTRQYTPFQDYGPFTNHMPLSFLIPGVVQYWFGPGIRTGRFYAIILGITMMIALWITARRLGGYWWATAAVWALALNPAVIKHYSLATSQVLVALLLTMTLVFALGENRPFWQILMGSFLAGVIMMTRINMSPVLPILLAYVFWQHGSRVGIWATIIGFATVSILHLFFWPGILTMWAVWMPERFTPFLDAYRLPEGTLFWDPSVSLENRAISLFHGFRFHFVALLGVLSTWFFWARKERWISLTNYKIAVFLSSLFGALWLSHIWAALGLRYCVFCYPVYLSFFDMLGILSLVVSFSSWERQNSRFRQILVTLFMIIVLAGMGFGAFDDIGNALLTIQVPRFRSFQIQLGRVELWGLFANRFGFSYEFLLRFIPAMAGVLIGILLLTFIYVLRQVLIRNHFVQKFSFASFFILALIFIGFVFAPTRVLGGGYSTYDCGYDAIASYEAAGEHLRGLIPPGSTVYWQGVLSSVPLLYLEKITIFPPQLNLDYSYRLSGDDRVLERFGLWSEPLGRRWVMESDYVLVAERYFKGWLKEMLVSDGQFIELPKTPSVAPCDQQLHIRIFRRNN